MVAKNIALGIVLLLVVATTVTAVDDICVKKTKQTFYQTAYSKDYSNAAVPDSKFIMADSDYNVILSGYRLEDVGWGPRLTLKVTYCKRSTNTIYTQFEMHPGSYKGLPGYNNPSISYVGPIPADLNVRCLIVGQKVIVASPLNQLLLSSPEGFEKLLFKKVGARHARTIVQSISRGGQPITTNRVDVTPPHALDEPVNVDAQNSCGAAVTLYQD